MQVIIPAEATLDHYKAAFVLLRERNLPMSNLTVAYPQKSFNIGGKDICVGTFISRPTDTGRNYNSLHDVLVDLHRQNQYAFLTHIPSQLLMCHREHDKTRLAIKLFDSFEAFRRNYADQFSIQQKINERRTITAGKYRIICADSKESYLTPEDRIALYKTGFQYIVFAAENTIGIQKTLLRRYPLLTDFAQCADLDPNLWFVHNYGHLVISKNNRTPDKTVDELCALLEDFLTQKPAAADVAD